MKFDTKVTEQFEKSPCILAFLIHSNRINAAFDNYISTAIEDLHPLTGENLCVFYLDTQFKKETWSRTKIETSFPMGYMVPGMKLKPIVTRTRVDEQVFLMEVGEYFLNGEYVRMPSIVFFESFKSKEFHVTELSGRSPEEVSNFLLRCATEARSVWANKKIHEDGVTSTDRKNTFNQFVPFLFKDKFAHVTKKVLQNNTILAMAGAAIGRI